jgi:hypothetical protein
MDLGFGEELYWNGNAIESYPSHIYDDSSMLRRIYSTGHMINGVGRKTKADYECLSNRLCDKKGLTLHKGKYIFIKYTCTLILINYRYRKVTLVT